jgi:hypothetical protein
MIALCVASSNCNSSLFVLKSSERVSNWTARGVDMQISEVTVVGNLQLDASISWTGTVHGISHIPSMNTNAIVTIQFDAMTDGDGILSMIASI